MVPLPADIDMDDTDLNHEKPPLSRWEHTNSFYNGETIITEIYEWKNTFPNRFPSVPGFTTDVIPLTITFVERNSGEIQDEHQHYFASRSLLEKLKIDFKKELLPLWKNARKLVSGFPAYTITDFSYLLDPVTDPQPRWYDPGYYIELSRSKLKTAAVTATFRFTSKKYNALYYAELLYNSAGEFCAANCHITRRDNQFDLRVRASNKGPFIKMIDCYKTGKRYGEKAFEANTYAQYIDALRRHMRSLKPTRSS